MIDLLTGHDRAGAYTLRAWTGIATDEGVGLITMAEVSDSRGTPVCRFELFVDASILRGETWPRNEADAARRLQNEALERARSAVLSETLHDLHGHRFDLES